MTLLISKSLSLMTFDNPLLLIAFLLQENELTLFYPGNGNWLQQLNQIEEN